MSTSKRTPVEELLEFDLGQGRMFYLLVMIVSLVISLVMLPPLSTAASVITLLCFLGMWYFGRWLVLPIIAILVFHLVEYEPQVVSVLNRGVDTVFTATFVLTFIFASSRYVLLKHSLVSYHSANSGIVWLLHAIANIILAPYYLYRLVRRLVFRRQEFGDSMEKEAGGTAPRQASTFGPSEVLSGSIRIIAAVALATILLASHPLNMQSGPTTGLIPTAHRTIRLAALLVLGATIIHFVIETLTWQFLPKGAAGTYLRSVLSEIHEPDFYHVARIYRKQRIRKSKQRRNES